MAENETVNEILDVLGIPDDEIPTVEKLPPAFKVIKEAKIMVSRANGPAWEKRYRAALKASQTARQAWQLGYEYYNANHVHDSVIDASDHNQRANRNSSENLVFANVSTMIPAIYSRNPDVKFTTDQDEDKPFCELLEKAVNSIFKKKTSPGVNLKPKMKKAVLHCALTNKGVLKLDYDAKTESSEEIKAQFEEIFKKIAKAKDESALEEAEGELLALETSVDSNVPSGFTLKPVATGNFICDPSSEDEDAGDSRWEMERVWFATSYLKAHFTEKEGEDEYRLIYRPKHKVNFGSGSGNKSESAPDIISSELDKTAGQTNLSESTEERNKFMSEDMTPCVWVWDRITRRVYLFQEDDWTWPIWVWNDPLNLSRFFPYFTFQFFQGTGGLDTAGEVAYYLDQQDEINTINAEISRLRRIAFNVIFYNSNKIKPDTAASLVEFIMDGKGNGIKGIDVPEGMKATDLLSTLVLPSGNIQQLFDKSTYYQSINRLTGISDVMRGEQFRTNTTNDAVEAYQTSQAVRVSTKTDSIEDCIQDIAWSIAEILIQNEDEEMIVGLVGEKYRGQWKPKSVRELNATMSCVVAAGSSEKPTSVFKKREAIQLVQAVGQFAKGAPGSTMQIMLRLLSRAFPDLPVTEQDLAAIAQETMAMMQKGGPAQANPEQDGAIPPELENLPPEVKKQVVERVQNGEDPKAVLSELMESQNAAA